MFTSSAQQVSRSAWHDAEVAAHSAEIEARELRTLEECTRLFRLFDSIWQPQPEAQPVTTEILRALSSSNSYVTGAFRDSVMVGGSVAFFGPPASRSLHSHITGVVVDGRNKSAGYTLKLHQRAWALDRGVEQITWTFDPLQRRNAYFNLCKLGTRPIAYLPNFYGPMLDSINGSDESDRLLVAWDVRESPTEADPAHQPRPAAGQWEPVHVVVDSFGGPLLEQAGPELAVVELPANIEDLRARDPQLAAQWRIAVRSALEPALATGASVRFSPKGRYELVAP